MLQTPVEPTGDRDQQNNFPPHLILVLSPLLLKNQHILENSSYQLLQYQS